MNTPGFLFGAGTPWTHDELVKKRELADMLMSNFYGSQPKNIGEGIGAIADLLAAKRIGKRAAKEDERMRNDFNSQFAGVFSGGGGYGLGGSYGGGGYTPPPPKSQWSQGETVSPEEMAAIDRISRTDWNGGTMTPDMFNTFGQGGSAGAGGYSMGVAPPSGGGVDGAFRAELLAGGLPEHVVDGIMMNAHDESAFNPTAVGDSGNAFGLLQWNGPRKRALMEWSAANGLDPSDPRTQAKFTVYELQGPEANAGRALLSTSTPGEAGAAFVNLYERPAEQHRASREAKYLGGGGFYGGGGSGPAPINPSMFGNIDEGQAPQQQPGPTGYGMGFTPQGGMPGGIGGGSMDLGTLAALAASPYASPEQKAIVNALMTQQMNAMDPMYQLQLQQEQLKLAQMQGGGAVDPTKNAPNGYMWTDPNDPSKGVTLIPGYTPSSGQNININTAEGGLPGLGKLDPGYTYLYDEQGNVRRDADGMPLVRAIPGSKAEQEQKAAEAEAAAAAAKSGKAAGNANISGDTTITAAQRALDAASGRLFGGVGSNIIGAINPYSDSAEVVRQVEVLKSMAAAENLQAMRMASPTGGALGNASDADIALLKNKSGALDPQSPNFDRDVKDYTRTLLRVIHGDEAGEQLYNEWLKTNSGGATQPAPEGLTEDDMKWLQ